MSLELVVVAIIILIVALVVIGIFTGGIQNFMNIFNFQSDAQIKQSLCQTACANYCFTHPQLKAGTSLTWVDKIEGNAENQIEKPQYKGKSIDNCQTCTCGS